jgi:hypothetical protein
MTGIDDERAHDRLHAIEDDPSYGAVLAERDDLRSCISELRSLVAEQKANGTTLIGRYG